MALSQLQNFNSSFLFICIVMSTVACTANSTDVQFNETNKLYQVVNSSSFVKMTSLSIEDSKNDDDLSNKNNYHFDDKSTDKMNKEDFPSTTEKPNKRVFDNIFVKPYVFLKSTNAKKRRNSNPKLEIPISISANVTDYANKRKETEEKMSTTENDDVKDDDDFCQHNYVDSAYFNGYDTILTRENQLWYYYKEQHKISKAYDQRRFTQGQCHLEVLLKFKSQLVY